MTTSHCCLMPYRAGAIAEVGPVRDTPSFRHDFCDQLRLFCEHATNTSSSDDLSLSLLDIPRVARQLAIAQDRYLDLNLPSPSKPLVSSNHRLQCEVTSTFSSRQVWGRREEKIRKQNNHWL